MTGSDLEAYRTVRTGRVFAWFVPTAVLLLLGPLLLCLGLTDDGRAYFGGAIMEFGGLALVMGVFGLIGALLWAPGVDPDPDLVAFISVVLLAMTMLALAGMFGVERVRHVRRLRRLAAQPAGERRPLLRVVGSEAERPWIVVAGNDGPVGIPLIPLQDVGQLADDDGLVDVVGRLRHGGAVVLRTRTGDPVWPSGPAQSRPTLGSLM